MLKRALPFCLSAAVLTLGGCDSGGDANNATTTAQPGEAQEGGGDRTIAASLDQNGRFFQAARAVGLDATLAGPGPYTVLVPSDEAFAQVQQGALADPANPQNRAEITRVLTYHILPGVILAEDIGSAIDNGNGRAILATMGGETLTATREGDTIVLSDGGEARAVIRQADVRAANGVVHRIDRLLQPPAPGQGGAGQEQGAPAANQQ